MSHTYNAKEYKVVCLRECVVDQDAQPTDTAERAAAYWRQHISNHPYFNPDVECFVVLLLNSRKKVKGHALAATGTADTVFTHARETFRAAIVASATQVIVMHNHPSGDSTPSEADIKITRDLIRAGEIIKIAVLDHVIMGAPTSANPLGYTSLRELGYFYS